MDYTIQKSRNKLTTESVDLKNYTRKKNLKKDKKDGVNFDVRPKPISHHRISVKSN